MKPTNPMAQLQQWKANNTKRLVSDGGVSVNGVHPNALKIELVKSAIKNCEIDCETAKRSKTQRTLDNTGFIKRNCETGCEFAKAQNDSVKNANQTNFGLVKNSQGNEHRETKNKYQGKLSINPLVAEYSQLTRQFKLIHDSNRKCLEVYPGDFHHKLKMRGECVDLVERLKGGGKLFNELAKGTNLNAEQTALLKSFNQLNGYLIFKFAEVAKQIDELNLERMESIKLQGGNDE
ncbi:hypothetical protein [Aggregatibacter segnis]|uniref:hypothetical protein n=1 Tax=Aggregatibacter segnis TaxID=739 RepID=UPI000D6878AC|nr:hypothetical protein [Aggregatibacter segnis]